MACVPLYSTPRRKGGDFVGQLCFGVSGASFTYFVDRAAPYFGYLL